MAVDPLRAPVTAGGSRWFGRLLYAVGRDVAWVLLHALFRVRVEGRAAVPQRRALLVVANHTSSLDPMLLAVAVPRPVAFLAKEELFHPAPWGWALRAAGMIPVRRGHADRQALNAALDVLRAGGALAVFAEGTRSADGTLQPAEAGVGMLAARSGAPVLPVALLGTERVRHFKGWLGRPPLRARFGAAWQPEPTARGRAAAYAELAHAMMERVAALLPEARRGAYGGAAIALGGGVGQSADAGRRDQWKSR